MLAKPLLIAAALVFLAATANGQDSLERPPWYFTVREIEAAYRYQEMFGERLQKPARARDCSWGRTQFLASFGGKEFLAPCTFVSETIRHLREMLEIGAARYLFPLDLDHAHLAIPAELWEKKYRGLPKDNILPALLTEPALVALYHASEHLTIVDPRTGKENLDAKAWKEKRNVLGFYDGRPIKILPPDPTGAGVSLPKTYFSFGGFSFLASPKGELLVFLTDKIITFDITFEIGTPAEDQIVGPPVAKQPTS